MTNDEGMGTENAVIQSKAKRARRILRLKLKISQRDSSTLLGMTVMKMPI